MKEIARKIILAAIAAKTPCIVRYEDKGISLSPRDSIYENEQVLELYMANSNSEIRTALRIYNNDSKESDMRYKSCGNLFIDWDEVRNISISKSWFDDRYFIKIDGLSLNFTKEIKDFEL